ncbi:response regulator [Neobacillus rhizophilus]|uniref:Response regulator transcription factor n=1 Tax=Neobacillus rhizophilus TaxID=2833579 RepID=A0A942YV26_9BACI|nr:response regulator transcription factor [Neobacillus rhizophilus]MBS4214603.1 response regulator transcription factor [Neobacillus rhizophilus]MBU8918499.1 response regulator transcription factor [Bacillus sp. FJAT-29953]
MSVIRLLIADDQELIRESLSIVLDMDDEIEIVGLAENGAEAIELCEQHKPNTILMDINMPVMDGISATKIIKQRWPDIKIIILTTFQEVNHVIDSLTLGAEGYLLKAIHPKDLLAGIKLIHKGGTLLPQDLAKLLVQQINSPETQSLQGNKNQYDLTEREEEVLKCIAQGLSNKLIAERLFLSEGTVKNYISSIYHKLDVKDRFQAAVKAQQEGLI